MTLTINTTKKITKTATAAAMMINAISPIPTSFLYVLLSSLLHIAVTQSSLATTIFKYYNVYI
ncbi:hypothetical protein RU88_GL000974 [Lactococcus raffinolactis]|nr:hypothetical protein RU88_GL000974 [Lactococcus raffinolactis]